MTENRKERWLSHMYRALGQIYVPEALQRTGKKKILHISDTPYHIFAPINRLITRLKPDIIIHTGDMVDDIKLETSSIKLPTYQKSLRRILRVLEGAEAEKVYVVPGNHDDRDTLKASEDWIEIMDEGSIIRVEHTLLGLAHDGLNLPADAQYLLYGHNTQPGTGVLEGRTFLNGIQNIHVILLPEPEVYYLPYPAGTDDARLLRGKISL